MQCVITCYEKRFLDLRSLQQILAIVQYQPLAISIMLYAAIDCQLTLSPPLRSELLMCCACRMLLQILCSQQSKMCGSRLQHLLVQGELRGVHPMHCSSRLILHSQKDKGRRDSSLPVEGEVLPACILITRYNRSQWQNHDKVHCA